MVIIGRLTKDATITTLKDERKVVNFTVAVNDYYKPKGQEKGITATNYFNCSYWINTGIAEKLKKGGIVEVSGRMSVNAYVTLDNEARATLNFHVNTITIHQYIKGDTASEEKSTKKKKQKEAATEDLPF